MNAVTVNLSLSDILTIAGAVCGFFLPLVWGLLKLLAKSQEKSLTEKFTLLTTNITTVSAEVQTTSRMQRDLENKFLELKAELPKHYVMRDDFNRAISTFHVNLDNLRLTIERALLRSKNDA